MARIEKEGGRQCNFTRATYSSELSFVSLPLSGGSFPHLVWLGWSVAARQQGHQVGEPCSVHARGSARENWN